MPTGAQAGGRFGDAMHAGMELGAVLPEEMVEFIDRQRKTARPKR